MLQNGDKVDKLNVMVSTLTDQIGTMAKQLDQYKAWQLGDKYLRQDVVIKETIDEHETKVISASMEEQKELADAAYQTIKTLQDMLDSKN